MIRNLGKKLIEARKHRRNNENRTGMPKGGDGDRSTVNSTSPLSLVCLLGVRTYHCTMETGRHRNVRLAALKENATLKNKNIRLLNERVSTRCCC